MNIKLSSKSTLTDLCLVFKSEIQGGGKGKCPFYQTIMAKPRDKLIGGNISEHVHQQLRQTQIVSAVSTRQESCRSEADKVQKSNGSASLTARQLEENASVATRENYFTSIKTFIAFELP